MARHKYAIGQEVNFLPSGMDFNVPRGTYTIVRQLPLEAAGFQYPGQERERRPRADHSREPACRRGQHLGPAPRHREGPPVAAPTAPT